jgi:hypothetical protein
LESDWNEVAHDKVGSAQKEGKHGPEYHTSVFENSWWNGRCLPFPNLHDAEYYHQKAEEGKQSDDSAI